MIKQQQIWVMFFLLVISCLQLLFTNLCSLYSINLVIFNMVKIYSDMMLKEKAQHAGLQKVLAQHADL